MYQPKKGHPMPIAIVYPTLTYLIDDGRLTPAASRPCTVTYGGVTSRPVVIADTQGKARQLDTAMTAAMRCKGLPDTCVSTALWLDDADIIAAASAVGCPVVTP